jgi:hypothetical protein
MELIEFSTAARAAVRGVKPKISASSAVDAAGQQLALGDGMTPVNGNIGNQVRK